ncbi:MAG TPA: SpoIIE family protein phosphatase [Verrucomicrobiae bacterium]|jgi:sigma-B regulation protein RsbU (phosphoserine phosphatase)|nr:SpoIIE family protein phosphatase [Verrucomicrobiae bacterium]
MDPQALKILFIGNEDGFAHDANEALRTIGGTMDRADFDRAASALKNNSFSAILFEPGSPNTASLFQVTALTIQAPHLPVIVVGSANDESFAVETINAGAQGYLAREEFQPDLMRRTIRCAIERQIERSALVAEKENYYGIFDHLIEGIFRTTPDGHYMMANVALARIYGYNSPADVIANITDIAHSLYVETGRREEFVELMQGNDVITGFESKIYRKDQTVIWISENCRAVRDAEGKVLYYEGTVEDITERKHAEEQIRRTTAELSRSREDLRGKNQAMEENLRMAREIQLTMLPQQYPTFPRDMPADQSAFQFTHRYHSAEAVSGDFFAVSALSDEEVGVLICDVTGHGIRAALVTAMIRALAEELKPCAHDPGFFLRKLNSDLYNILKTTGSPMLTTAFYFVANWQTGVMRFANAGHPKPLLVRRPANSVTALSNSIGRSQPALGLFDNPPYETSETQIAPGDLIMLFTDGLYEVQGSNEELYSQERLIMDLRPLIAKPTNQLFDELQAVVRNFAVSHEFEDDVCLVGLDFVQKPQGQKS